MGNRCTAGDSEEVVRKRAEAAAQFFRQTVSEPVAALPRPTQFERVIPYKVDAWLADAALNAT